MTTLPMNMAMYDLMGQVLGQPAWKLIGLKVRDRIPVAAWTVSQQPKNMVVEVEHAVRQGYRWLKYHVDEIQNVVDQTAAMQEVVPRNFKVLSDFNANSTLEAVAPVVKQLEPCSVAGRIEDPIVASNAEGWRTLHEIGSLPIIDGHVKVSEGPGLGVTLNRDKLEHYASAKRPRHEPFLVRIRYQGGPTIFVRHNPELPRAADNLRFRHRLLGKPIPGPIPAYDNPVVSDFWDDLDSTHFQRLWKESENGPVTE